MRASLVLGILVGSFGLTTSAVLRKPQAAVSAVVAGASNATARAAAPHGLNSTAFAASARNFFDAFHRMSGKERVVVAARCVPDYNAKASAKHATPKEAFWPMDVDFTNHVEPNEWTDATVALEVDATESWFAFLSIDANSDRRLSGAEFFDAVGKDGSPVVWAEPGTTGPGAKPPHSFERDFNDSAHWEDYVNHDDQKLPKHLKKKLEEEKVPAGMTAVALDNATLKTGVVQRLNATAFADSARNFFETFRRMSGKERVEMAARCVPDYNAKASAKHATPKEAFWPMDVDFTNHVEPNEWTDATVALEVDATESWFAFLSIDANSDRRLSGAEFFNAVGKNGSPVDWAEPGTTGPGAKPPQSFERDFDHAAHWEDYTKHDDQNLPKHLKKKLEQEKSQE